MKTRNTASSRRAGFTLVELMVAMTAGLITIAGAQYLSGNAARNISDQMRLSDTQMSLRSGMEQVRRDFARAGYLSTRNSMDLTPMVCGAPIPNVSPLFAQPLAAARVLVDGSFGLPTGAALTTLLNRGTNLRRADVVTLVGSYAAGTMFPVSNVVATPSNELRIDDTTVTFQMLFFDAPTGGGPAVYNPSRFREVFAPNRALRFESDGRSFFRVITVVDANVTPPSVTLDSGLPSEVCAPRANSFVSVVSMIEYTVDPAGAVPDIANLVPPTPSIADGSEHAVLVRREIDFTTNAPVVPSSASVVLDNVVEFEVNGIVNTALPPATPVFARVDDTTATTIEELTQDITPLPHAFGPEQLRSLIVTLSARSMEGDRRRTPIVSPRPNPMLTFVGVNPNAAGTYVSRVRTIRGEVFLPNTVNR